MCGIVGLLLKKPALRPALGELMLGSTTRRVLAECRADVLVSVHTQAAP